MYCVRIWAIQWRNATPGGPQEKISIGPPPQRYIKRSFKDKLFPLVYSIELLKLGQ